MSRNNAHTHLVFFREMNKVTQRLLMLKKQNNTMTEGERKRDYCSTTLDPGKF
jgi:hypothetical protein